jgi:excisionase family DNA binding protein
MKGTPAVTHLMPVLDAESTATVHDIRALVYTVPEVAKLLAVSRNTAYLMVRTGQLPARRLGTRWVVPRKAFHNWLDATPIPDDTTTLANVANWS